MSRILSLVMIVILISSALVLLSGCRVAECQQMSECCLAVEDVDGVGPSCKGLADDTNDANTCRTVVRTIGYMLEDQDETIPEACNLTGSR